MKPAALFLALCFAPATPLFAAGREPVAGRTVGETLVGEMPANKAAAVKARAQAGEKFCPTLKARLGAGWAKWTKIPATAAAAAAAMTGLTPSQKIEKKAVELCVKAGQAETGALRHEEAAVNFPDKRDENLAVAAKLRLQALELEKAAKIHYTNEIININKNNNKN